MNLLHATILNLFLLTTLIGNAQIKYTKGYIIDNNHRRFNCMIRNAGKEESTLNFQYKLKDDKEIKKIELSKIEEFGIDNEIKCVRALIDIDISPSRINNLKETPGTITFFSR